MQSCGLRQADVIIAAENPSYGNSPYTLQYGGCGSQGSYIHMTPSYLLNDVIAENFGPIGIRDEIVSEKARDVAIT